MVVCVNCRGTSIALLIPFPFKIKNFTNELFKKTPLNNYAIERNDLVNQMDEFTNDIDI